MEWAGAALKMAGKLVFMGGWRGFLEKLRKRGLRGFEGFK
jgi:hypothetical protein